MVRRTQLRLTTIDRIGTLSNHALFETKTFQILRLHYLGSGQQKFDWYDRTSTYIESLRPYFRLLKKVRSPL